MQGDRGLICGYPFENTGADIMVTHPLTVNGFTYDTGLFGQCANFDGVDDYGSVALNIRSIYGTNTPLTISFWAYHQTKKTPTIGDVGFASLATSYLSADPLILFNRITDSLIKIWCSGTYRFNVNVLANHWDYYTLTYDGTVWRFYLNTILLGSFTGGYGPYVQDHVYIGSGYHKVWFGKMENFKIHYVAANDSQIKRLYLNLPIF